MKTTTPINPQWLESCLSEVYAPTMIKRLVPRLNEAVAKRILAKYPPEKIRHMATKLAVELQKEATSESLPTTSETRRKPEASST